ncbi:ligand-dependent nuclear receptor-interacting factor 1 [Latimeria chalumnae]|uniref:ligand-dependent nuclear receptor-interacting factor 1 n=1 Tax=Latimeria chalumnae TaxID=7897 RepID=UPI0003C1A6BF|nr:PREDICTED: ligand-dependent nuclear receptor-interacting factor 1-like [Latimeria chalumnae]XP_014347556.1 PREDICTED: ligand-dependent nuclear receptor-interacting factor 1-like [Latimeria chalumnae]|eukprot:XP_005987650.1 PREDICTED: ligand-dependent nuclear receptor-interacting factor 1-like [Latimeria chalumnae]
MNSPVLSDMELYIPAHAQVRFIPVSSLPSVLLKGIGQPINLMSNADPSNLVHTVAYISPIQATKEPLVKHVANQQDSGSKNITSTTNRVNVDKETNTLQVTKKKMKANPFKISIRSSNTIAFEILKSLKKQQSLSRAVSRSVKNTTDSSETASTFKEDCLIVCNGKAYLFIFDANVFLNSGNSSQTTEKRKSVGKSDILKSVEMVNPESLSTPNLKDTLLVETDVSVEGKPEQKHTTDLQDRSEKVEKVVKVPSVTTSDTEMSLLNKFGIGSEVRICLKRTPLKNKTDQQNISSTTCEDLQIHIDGDSKANEVIVQDPRRDVSDDDHHEKHVESNKRKAQKGKKPTEQPILKRLRHETPKLVTGSSDSVTEFSSSQGDHSFSEQEVVFEQENTATSSLLTSASTLTDAGETDAFCHFSLPPFEVQENERDADFDFDETVRDEKIDRIKQLLREREMAVEAIRKKN